mmetsp:Transcript_26439/g.75691  ORF Transcript_26439/g.75691 Transcript_26439/m.75691 type:complete len:760 (-) Transcript_26439:48-2327(-)
MARFVTQILLLALAAAIGVRASSEEPKPTKEEWDKTKAEEAAAKDAVVAKGKKMAAVGKAVELMETLQAKVLEEGEAEAKTYEKFACFCKDTTKEKLKAIQKGEDEKASLNADIAELSSKRDGLDRTIQETLDEISLQEMSMKQASQERAEALTLYQTNTADLQSAIDSLEGALKTLKASKTPSFAQVKTVSNIVRTAVLLADTLGLGGGVDKKVIAFVQQEPSNGNEVPMEDYDFHSNGILALLEKLQDDFRAEKVSTDKIEADSLAEFEMFTQAKTDSVKALNHKLEETKQEKDETIADTESANQRLTVVEATLLDDKEYTNKLSKMCSDKAKTWDQRTNLRAAELSTLTQAIGIIKGAVAEKTSAATIRFAQQGMTLRLAKAVASDAPAMQAIEAEAEAAEDALAFVQVQQKALLATTRRHLAASKPDDSTQAVVNLLRTEGAHLKSTLLTSLASKIAGDPFGKVKALIQELIERLLQESANESSQKGWCDKSNSDAGQKRDYAAEEVRTLNSEMAKLEAVRDQLAEELDILAKDIKDIKDAQKQAQEERDAESAQNKATVEEAQEGLDALNMCIDLLDKFYKTMAKETVDLSLAQKGPADDAPDAGFDNGEAYIAGQSESGGILAMLDVMKTDFTRTIEETQKAEEQAEQDHLEFMTQSGMSLAKKEEAEKAKKEQKDDTEEQLGTAEDNLHSQSNILQESIKELLDLKPVCIDTGMSYEERVSRREDEIASLNKAMCILERYAEYGPEGAADGC